MLNVDGCPYLTYSPACIYSLCYLRVPHYRLPNFVSMISNPGALKAGSFFNIHINIVRAIKNVHARYYHQLIGGGLTEANVIYMLRLIWSY